MPLTLKNPHSIIEILKARPDDVVELSLSQEPTDDWRNIARICSEKGVRSSAARKGVGGFAVVKEKKSIAIEELFANAKERQGGHALWLALDCLQDPHNVGAIFRTAAFFGVQGIVLTQERSSGLTPTVYDVASGGVEVVPFSVEVNLKRSLEKAKEAGVWIIGSSEHAGDSHLSVPRDRPWLLVLGNEESGMRRLTEESCDLLCAIKPVESGSAAKVTSLNVSVAGGILISHLSLLP